MKIPSGPTSTPTRPPAASGWFTSTFGEPLIMYCFGVNSILVKSVPCAQRPNESATAAIAAIDNCHAGFMTWLLVRGFCRAYCNLPKWESGFSLGSPQRMHCSLAGGLLYLGASAGLL